MVLNKCKPNMLVQCDLYYSSLHSDISKSYMEKCFCKILGGMLTVCIVIDVASVFGIIELSHIMGRFISPFRFVVDSNAPMALLTSVVSFMFFKNLRIRYSKVINMIGSTTFGILLIHSQNSAIRLWLWRDVFDCAGHYAASFYWAYAIVSILIVYFSCSVIDYIRICTLEKWAMNWLDKRFFKKR